MDTSALAAWAAAHGDGPVDQSSDTSLSLTSKLLRFRWKGGPAVGVGSDAAGKVRINSVLDGVAWFLARGAAHDDTLDLVLGTAEHDPGQIPFKEHVGAIGTLIGALSSGPTVRVWLMGPGGEPREVAVEAPAFTTKTPQRWNALLMSAAIAPVTGMAADLVSAIHHPSFALYPKLSSQKGAEPWQMRLDGLAIGRAGATSATLHFASSNPLAGEPHATWRKIVGQQSIAFTPSSIDKAVALIDGLIVAWTAPRNPAAVLQHGQAEHALEAHILSDRLQLKAGDILLRSAVPFRSRMLGAAQFPTLWGDVSGPARYLDALLADHDRRPWAVELKDQHAGGGHGAYLRHGIGQAVLYRHFIRSAAELDPWFAHHGLDRQRCRAALAFPTTAGGAAKTIARLGDLAPRFDVDIIEFVRPGGTTS